MKYPASKTRSLNIAFVVDATHLRRLAEILSEIVEDLDYTVKFTDGTSVRYSAIEEVIRQPNSKKRSIVSLIAGVEQAPKSAYVNIKKSGLPSLEYTIAGAQRDVIYLADKLDDWVATIRQWYSPFLTWAGPLLALLAIGLPMYVSYRVTTIWPSTTEGKGAVVIASVMILIGATELCALLLLFPRGTFAVGNGEKRHALRSWIRVTILVGLCLSIIAGVIANWITRNP